MVTRSRSLAAAPVFIQSGPQWRFTARPGLGGLGYSASLLDSSKTNFDPTVNNAYALTDAQENLDSSSLQYDTNFFSDDSQNIGDYIQGGSYDANYYSKPPSSDVGAQIASFFTSIFGVKPAQARPVAAPVAPKPASPSWMPWVIGGGAAVLGIGAVAMIASSRKR